MARRPDSLPGARRAMREALDRINGKTPPIYTPCDARPIPYEVRQTPEEAAEKCGRGTKNPCPVLDECEAFGYTEGVYADDMVYGGYIWRRGVPLPLVSKTKRKPLRAPQPKISNGAASLYT